MYTSPRKLTLTGNESATLRAGHWLTQEVANVLSSDSISTLDWGSVLDCSSTLYFLSRPETYSVGFRSKIWGGSRAYVRRKSTGEEARSISRLVLPVHTVPVPSPSNPTDNPMAKVLCVKQHRPKGPATTTVADVLLALLWSLIPHVSDTYTR